MDTPYNEVVSILELLRVAGKLKTLTRKGWGLRGVEDAECVADHSYRLALMAMLYGDQTGLDTEKMMKMALLHDLAEAEVGDITPQDGVSVEEKEKREMEALGRILSGVSDKGHYISLFNEFNQGATPEARMVREIDQLEMIIQAKEYTKEHPKLDLSEFWEGARKSITIPSLVKVLDELGV